MLGIFITRLLLLVLGYAYPAFECFKIVEKKRVQIEELRFWCQYWIIVALLTVFERIGGIYVSGLPMYSEMKLAFFIYLWYPRTKGTGYVYETLLRPCMAKHEIEIGRNLLELRARAWDLAIYHWQHCTRFWETTFFLFLEYLATPSAKNPISEMSEVTSQSQSMSSISSPPPAPKQSQKYTGLPIKKQKYYRPTMEITSPKRKELKRKAGMNYADPLKFHEIDMLTNDEFEQKVEAFIKFNRDVLRKTVGAIVEPPIVGEAKLEAKLEVPREAVSEIAKSMSSSYSYLSSKPSPSGPSSKQSKNYEESLGEDYANSLKPCGNKMQPHEFHMMEQAMSFRDTSLQNIGTEAEVQHIVEGAKVQIPGEAESDIPKYAKNCILYCSLFPTGYEFTKDTLVWLWIARGLVEAGKNERMEDVGARYFDYLLKWKYVVPSGFDHFADKVSYKVGNAMTSILEKRSLGLPYGKVVDARLTNVSIVSTDLSLICEDIDQSTFEALKKCKYLRTLLLFRGYCSPSIRQVPRDLFLGSKFLQVLDLSGTNMSELPSSIGNLKWLRYVDVSETPIERLPESIDCLHNLQTLRLRGCLSLNGLPKRMNKLINLRHLDIDVARQLKLMPIGMGNLTSLQTLKAFLVGGEDGCRIGELKNMNNLSGSFCISRLENVLNKEEAREAALSNKQYLKKLELRWGDLRDKKAEDEEEILECLQPHPSLQELRIFFYSGSVLPTCISNPSFASIVSVSLYKCRNCHCLPSIGELPSLKFLYMVEMNRVTDINHLFCRNHASQGYHAFPKLEKLTLDVMVNLEEWTGVENGDFPCLLQLTIKYCPKLNALPFLSHLNSLKHLEISHCVELSSLPEEGLPASLQFLIVRDCPTLKERCHKEEGEDWLKIKHVPSIYIDHQEISLN